MIVGNGGKRLNGCAGIEVKRPEGYCAGVGKNGGYGDLSGGVRIEEVLEREGVLVSTTVGVSMYPMLRNRRDTVIVSPASGHLKKYDVPLYRRGGKYVLHRIVDVVDDRYVICGDNCIRREYDITDREIIGVLTGFYRGDREMAMDSIGYRIYVRVWCALYPVRKIYKLVRMEAGKMYRCVKKRNL